MSEPRDATHSSSEELKQWQILADLTLRPMGARPKLSAAYIAYSENGKRTPSLGGAAALVRLG